MLLPSHEIRVKCKVIKSTDIDLVYNFLGKRDRLASWLRTAMWRRWHFSLDYQMVQNEMFTYKIYLYSCRSKHGLSSLVSADRCQLQISGSG